MNCILQKATRFFSLFMLSYLLASYSAVSCAKLVEYKEGIDYSMLSQSVQVSDDTKVEVAEAFWYGCPHCYTLEATLKPWAEQLPDEVYFKKLPALFGREGRVHAALYYTLRTLNADSKVDDAVFNSIHKQGKRLNKPDEIADFLVDFDIPKEKTIKLLKSFGVKNQVRIADSILRGAKLMGVPALIINGKYIVPISKGPNYMLSVADFLIAKEKIHLKTSKSDALAQKS